MSKNYTEPQDYEFTPLADNLPTMSQKNNDNLERIRSYVPEGILEGGAVDSTTAVVINFDPVKFHYDAVHYDMTSNLSFTYNALADGIHYVYFKKDASAMDSVKESDYANARTARETARGLGVLAARIDTTSNNLMEIDDIREIIPEMLEDLSELKYYEVGQYLETISPDSNKWTIVHNLDTEYISSVQCYKKDGSDYTQIIPNYIKVLDKDTLEIDWGGTTIVNGRVKIER